jgi:hypothetical protein
MSHVMCNSWKRIFTLVPMAPLPMISFACDIHPNYDGSNLWKDDDPCAWTWYVKDSNIYVWDVHFLFKNKPKLGGES